MAQEIIVIDNKQEIIDEIKEIFKEEAEYKFKRIMDAQLEYALRNIPALFVINADELTENIIDICKKIRNDDDNNITPVIVLSSDRNKEHKISVLNECVEYYINKPMDKEYLYYTIKNLLRLINTNRRISPLTGLPRKCSNTRRIKETFNEQGNFLGSIFRFRQLQGL
mgnify:CR=1 FL=1